MEPAQKNAVVCVRRAAQRMADDMVDLAPGGRHVAARDDAAAVARDDRAALMSAEDPLWPAELDDPTAVVVDETLDSA